MATPQNTPMAAAPQDLQNTVSQLSSFLETLKKELDSTKAELSQTKQALANAQTEQMGNAIIKLQKEFEQVQATQPATDRRKGKAKANQPSPFTGKGAGKIEAWASQMDLYVSEEEPQRAFTVALSYLEGDAHSWYTTYSATSPLFTWEQLREALIRRFSPLDKTLSARDKLAKWRQMKDVSAFNTDFLRIVLDIPDITESEKMDRYQRGLKSYIWEVLCTKDYDNLEAIMTDALKVEAAKKGNRNQPKQLDPGSSFRPSKAGNSSQAASGPVPMELGSTAVTKLTPDERQRCMREGLCLRCRQPGHLAKDCPKGQGRESGKPNNS